jgi:plastocyanin
MPAPPVAKTLRTVGVLAGAAASIVGAGGCSVKRGGNPNLVAGKQEFVSKCGACHILARANTKGMIGPNLDDAFRASLAGGLKRSTILGVVHGQILEPNPGGAMPKNLVHGADVENIAAYVAKVAAEPGQDSGLLATAVKAAGSGKPAVETAGKLEIDADPSGQLAYVTKQASAKPGPVTVTMKNAASIGHNIAVQQGTSGAVLSAGPVVQSGGTSSVKVTLKPGTYTYFCQVPGHRAGGMLGTLTVK